MGKECFKIPVMSIQDALMCMDDNKEFKKLVSWLDALIKKERDNWGIMFKGYHIEYDLEQQWYPVFYFTNRWLADMFVKCVGNI